MIESEGAAYIVDALKQNQTIKDLNLGGIIAN